MYFFNIRMECEKKFDGIFYSVETETHVYKMAKKIAESPFYSYYLIMYIRNMLIEPWP